MSKMSKDTEILNIIKDIINTIDLSINFTKEEIILEIGKSNKVIRVINIGKHNVNILKGILDNEQRIYTSIRNNKKRYI